MSSFDLNTVVEDICRSFAAKALSRDLDFAFVPSGDPLWLFGNPVLVREALINLLENALTHGGGEMTAINVRTSSDEAGVVITVEDDGFGIPPDKVSTVFRRFSQLQYGEGTGLGLAIVEQVMVRHAGSVDLVPGEKGKTFRLWFPRTAEA